MPIGRPFGLRGRFGAILADPPWQFRTYSKRGQGRSAENHYPTMSLQDIKALPVGSLAGPDCALFLWTTDPMLPQALEVMAAWGFAYKTVAFTWVKTNEKTGAFPMGTGFWTRANPEQVLLGTRGRPTRLARDVPRLVIAPRREHSEKPGIVNTEIERLVAGPYVELFARFPVAGWSVWGHHDGAGSGAAGSPRGSEGQARLRLLPRDGARQDAAEPA